MFDPLDGIRLKRKRSWSQLHSLKPEIIAFIESDPYKPRIKLYREAEQLAIWVDVQREADPMWSVRIGEIIHNFRCCLDYLVYNLHIWENPKVQPPRVQFPIFMSPDRFKREGIGKFVPGIRKSFDGMFRAVQPFSTDDGGTGEGQKSPLWQLYELSNADKHRALQFTGALIREYRFKFAPAVRDFSYRELERMKPGPIQHNTTLWRGKLACGGEWPFSQNQIHGTLSIDIAFDKGVEAVEGCLVYDTLADIANRTDCILRKFFEAVWNTEL